MAYGDSVMEAIRGTVLDGRPRVGGVSDGEAARRERRRLALSAAAEYARSGRGGQGDADMHLERAAEEALSQAAFAGIMTYGRSAFALGRRTLADQLARRRASAGTVLLRSRYQAGPFGEGVETLSDATLNPSTLTGARPAGRLGEVATVSEEYSRAYPGMERDVVVNVVPDSAWDGYVAAAKRARAEWAKTSDTSRGFFDRRLSAVSIRAQMPGETMEAYFDRADRTLVHELQHYAQMRDGLPATSPGSGYEWYRTAAREVEARNSANRLALTPQERLEMPRANTQDVKPKDVHLDDKGGRAVRAGIGAGLMLAASIGPAGAQNYEKATGKKLGDLEKAQAMKQGFFESDTAFARRMIKETGWQQEAGKWKYETPYDPVLKPGARASGGGATKTVPLTDMLDYSPAPELLLAYPELAKAQVILAGDQVAKALRAKNATGAHLSGGRILVDPGASDEELENTLLHEADHERYMLENGPQVDGQGRRKSIQGVSDDVRYWHADDEVDARNVETRKRLTPAQRRATPLRETADVDEDDRIIQQAAKGGDNFGTFRNFLATDDVPETLFGFPVVQDKSQYTEKDLEFFRKNPKAAGFYDLGDEEVDEDVPRQAAKAKPSRGAYPGSLNNPGNVEKRRERRQGEVDSPSERFAKFATPQDGLREMADVIRQIAEVKLAEKGLPFTIRNFAGAYAPDAENDTAKYVADISADSGFGPDEELHRFDEGDMARLLKSVVRFESGAPHAAWFTDEEYAEAAKKLQEGAID